MTELRLVHERIETDSAQERAQWLVELADIQQFSMERIGQRYFDWNRLSTSAEEAAAIFVDIETVGEKELVAA